MATSEYHKTRLLLSIYRTVVWRTKSALWEIKETACEYGGQRISELLDFLCLEIDDYDFNKDKKDVEERLMCTCESIQMIEIIDKALIHLKSYPNYGEIYHDIIYYSYINKDKTSDEQIRRKINVSQSTYYRYKKQAIENMGVALWGYIIPPLSVYWEELRNASLVGDKDKPPPN